MTAHAESRSLIMSRSIEGTKVQYPFRFVIAGRSRPLPDPLTTSIFHGAHTLVSHHLRTLRAAGLSPLSGKARWSSTP